MQSSTLICLIPLVTGMPYSSFFNFNNFGVKSFIQEPVQKAGSPFVFSSHTSPFYYYTKPNARANLRTGDIIADTRALSNSVQATLRQLGADPASAVIVNRIINDKDNICVASLEDGLAGIETATRLVERARDDQ